MTPTRFDGAVLAAVSLLVNAAACGTPRSGASTQANGSDTPTVAGATDDGTATSSTSAAATTTSSGASGGSGNMESGGAASGGAASGGIATVDAGGAGASTSLTNTSNAGGGTAGTGSVAPNTQFEPVAKPRVLVLTDISNEPDDEESLVRFLVYANEYDVEGLIATTSTHLENGPTREDLIREQLAAYEQVRPNLLQHAPGYPTADELRAVTATGQTGYSMDAVGDGLASGGSNLIISSVDEQDERPLWISIWGGANTLAQALTDVRSARSTTELEQFVAKLRVYSISDQDHAGPWLREQFPDLYYVVSPSDDTADQYYLATWTGISGDEHYDNGPGYRIDLVANSWLTENVAEGHGALGALYPPWTYIMEGDTPSFLGLIDNGLGSSVSPSYGGWGGRYVLSRPPGETREIWTNSADTVEYEPGASETSDQATIWRWRAEYQYDFAARMDWCSSDAFSQANHNPIPALNGDTSRAVLTLSARAGDVVELSAEGTDDPDGDSVMLRWFTYLEAGTMGPGAELSDAQGVSTQLSLPADASGTLHVILHAEDDGTPPLSAYRRTIVRIEE